MEQTLESVLSYHFNRRCRIAKLKQRISDYCSSFTIEEIEAVLKDGATLQLIFKDLSWHALIDKARLVKPAFLYNPLREIETYRSILPSQQLGTAIYYGAVADNELARYWLFLEKVAGMQLRHVGEFTTWQQVARWLAAMHTRFAVETEYLTLPPGRHLLRYDGEFFRLWMRRAQVFLRQVKPALPQTALRGIDWLATRYAQVIERLASLPATFIHGEFFAGNVLIQEVAGGIRICPVDWEMAGIGTGLLDLAAFTAGTWSEEQKVDLAMAYYAALQPTSNWPPPRDVFLTALDYCHLHLAVQWLGWSLNWSPPPGEAQDWLGKALRLAEKLSL